MPRAIGAVDGLLIPIKASHDQEHLYVCHKSFHVINTMAVCNAQLSFTNCVNKKKDVISFMKNCGKDSHVNHNNRQNSLHAINKLKIQHIDSILKLHFLSLTLMTISSMVSMDVKS